MLIQNNTNRNKKAELVKLLQRSWAWHAMKLQSLEYACTQCEITTTWHTHAKTSQQSNFFCDEYWIRLHYYTLRLCFVSVNVFFEINYSCFSNNDIIPWTVYMSLKNVFVSIQYRNRLLNGRMTLWYFWFLTVLVPYGNARIIHMWWNGLRNVAHTYVPHLPVFCMCVWVCAMIWEQLDQYIAALSCEMCCWCTEWGHVPFRSVPEVDIGMLLCEHGTMHIVSTDMVHRSANVARQHK